MQVGEIYANFYLTFFQFVSRHDVLSERRSRFSQSNRQTRRHEKPRNVFWCFVPSTCIILKIPKISIFAPSDRFTTQ